MSVLPDFTTIPPDVTTFMPNTTMKCNQYIYKNKTHIFNGGSSFEGIPENLLINVVGWLLLLCLFSLLRKNAWNYGRLALVQKYDDRSSRRKRGFSEYNVWTQLFYSSVTEPPKHTTGHIPGHNPAHNHTTTSLGQSSNAARSRTSVDSTANTQAPGALPTNTGDPNDSIREVESVASVEYDIHRDTHTFSWIPTLFTITDADILSKSGRDAVHYLSFQRHMIAFMAVVMLVCLCVILPINYTGNLDGGENEFSHTTISNLSPSSRLMWVHITLAFLFLPLGILFTRHHSRVLALQPADLDPDCESAETRVTRTLMITQVPRRSCHKDTLLRHFSEAYPDVEVLDVQFAYNIKELLHFDRERDLAHRARLYCENYEAEMGERLTLRPYKCGRVMACCGKPPVDAINYYTRLEETLSERVTSEKVKALHRPTGVAFVTLDSLASVRRVLQDHRAMLCRCLAHPPQSSLAQELRPQNWLVRMAPTPSNIYWKNLSVTTRHWWIKAFIINIILFIVLFFLTTPAIIINALDLLHLTTSIEAMSPILSEFLPTLLLWTIAALMPVLVTFSDRFMTHWTRSAENHSIMRKTFIFMLFMIIILPSLGLTSAKAFVEWIGAHQNETYRWECIFLPDNGAFFVNYIITSAFIGTTLELIRFPELFMYMIRLSLARSEAETASVRRAILYEFQFGVQYAYMLLNFTMCIVYSILCPIITPFGLLYMLMKHHVDKYNIYFAYGPSRISKNIHGTAVNFVMISIILLQLCLLFFSILRHGIAKPRSVYSLTLLCITVLVFLSHIFFNFFKELSPIYYKNFDTSPPDDPTLPTTVTEQEPDATRTTCADDTPVFVPEVLRDNCEELRSTSAYRDEDNLLCSGGGRNYGGVMHRAADENTVLLSDA